eukprot:6491750-Amphidinium_carterae.2
MHNHQGVHKQDQTATPMRLVPHCELHCGLGRLTLQSVDMFLLMEAEPEALRKLHRLQHLFHLHVSS